MSYDIIIPARNEEKTVGEVVRVAREAREVVSVFVIDDHSTDRTADAALRAGAEVIPSRARGDKAQALATGVARSRQDVFVFFDADIRNLSPVHFEALAAPVVNGQRHMVCGLVDYGNLRNPLFLRLPPISGMRAIRRSVFEAIPPGRLNGFQIEIMINEVIARGGLPTAIRVLSGTDHRSKVDKEGWSAGLRSHLKMTGELLNCFRFVPLWTYFAYLKALEVLPATDVLDRETLFERPATAVPAKSDLALTT